MNIIIEALTEKIYSHGHAIGRSEVNELGLPTSDVTPDLENAMWNLYLEYEEMLNLNEPIDFEVTLRDQNGQPIETKELNKLVLACIDSERKSHQFIHNVILNRNRAIPQNIQMNLNLNLGLPPNIDINQISQQTQQTLQQLVQQLLQQVQGALPSLVQKEIARQSPMKGFGARGFDGKWEEVNNGGN